MKIFTNTKEWQALRKQYPTKSIGFVPTMGHLHKGHISLCQRSKQDNDITVVSIYVNPLQFDQKKDLDCYPRTIAEDQALLQSYGIDYLLLPDTKEMYADQYHVQVIEKELSSILEGEFRPNHFNGVLTIVLKLFNIVQPTRAYFGEKDFQQYLIVKKMVDALFLPIEMIPCETIRAEDGLALSSRNSRLRPEQRKKAALFPQYLKACNKIEEAIEALTKAGFKIDYIAEKWQRRLGAVWLEDIRLIDNMPINT